MFLLGWTIEKIQLPHTSRIAARVEGKSSLARIGIGVHVTAPTIHAGFGYRPNDPNFPGNPIQLEIWNTGPFRIRLVKGLRICQLIFEEVHLDRCERRARNRRTRKPSRSQPFPVFHTGS